MDTKIGVCSRIDIGGFLVVPCLKAPTLRFLFPGLKAGASIVVPVMRNHEFQRFFRLKDYAGQRSSAKRQTGFERSYSPEAICERTRLRKSARVCPAVGVKISSRMSACSTRSTRKLRKSVRNSHQAVSVQTPP